MKKTSLYENHLKSNGKIIEFAGYLLPMQYKSIITEHKAVREKCGMFDVSHMGEIYITGGKAYDLVQYLVCNNINGLKCGEARYSPMCCEGGGCVDDLIIYKIGENEYLLVVNASNKDKDYKWMVDNNIFKDKATVKDISQDVSQIALQGPAAYKILEKCFDELPEKNYTFNLIKLEDNSPCLISRTGYTGEDGFEIYCSNINAPILWERFLSVGDEDIMPCGLGARDTLRLESAMPLYGHELGADISPLEAGLGRFVRLDKDMNFIGKKALTAQKQEGLTRRRCGLKLTDRGIAREGARLYKDSEDVGYVTSGTMSIMSKEAIALAMVKRPYNKIGTELCVDVRGKKIPTINVKLPFYKK